MAGGRRINPQGADVRVALDRSMPTPAITFGLGGDATVPLSLDAAEVHAARVLALVMEPVSREVRLHEHRSRSP